MKKILTTLMLTASTVLLAQDVMVGLVGGAISSHHTYKSGNIALKKYF